MSTRACFADTPLRIRVSMSEIGSVIGPLSLRRQNAEPGIQKTAPPTPYAFPSSVFYQELFVTPVTSPSSASRRKHNRHMSNLRMKARGRPHRRHRFRWRILYFSVLASLATFAVVAI